MDPHLKTRSWASQFHGEPRLRALGARPHLLTPRKPWALCCVAEEKTDPEESACAPTQAARTCCGAARRWEWCLHPLGQQEEEEDPGPGSCHPPALRLERAQPRPLLCYDGCVFHPTLGPICRREGTRVEAAGVATGHPEPHAGLLRGTAAAHGYEAPALSSSWERRVSGLTGR